MPDTQQALGFGQSSLNLAPTPQPSFDATAELQQRRADHSAFDTYTSAFRQNSLLNGWMAEGVGNTLAPDPNYNPFTDPNLGNLSKGLPEEYLPYLWKSHSAAHAIYTASRLQEKVQDQQRLDDLKLGFVGNLGLGLISSPDTLLLDAIGVGAVASGAQGLRAWNAARTATSAIGKAANVAEDAAAVASRQTLGKSVAAGMAFGGAENAAIERLRQQYNFENSDEVVFMAGAMGSLFTAPFAAYGTRGGRRIAEAADREASALRALADAHDGKQLTPEQIKTINETHAQIRAVEDVQAGKVSQEDYIQQVVKTLKDNPTERAIEPELMGPQEPDHMWLDRLQERTRQQAQDIIQQFHTEADLTTRKMKIQARNEAVRIAKEEAAKTLRMRREAEANGPTLADLQTPTVAAPSALGAALKKAFGVEDPAQVLKLQQEQATRQAQTHHPVDPVDHEAAWKMADEASAAARKREEEAAWTHRELLAAEMVDPHRVAEPAAPEAPTAPPVEPPSDSLTTHSMVGQDVSFMTPDGDLIHGTVHKVNEFEAGLRAVVRDEDGKLHSVDPKSLDQWPHEHAPEGFLPNTAGAAQALPVTALEDVERYASQFTGYPTVPGTNGQVKVPLRFDLYAFLNESENSVVRKLGNVLLRDPTGFKDKGRAQGMTAGEWRDQLRRTVAGEFHLAARDALNEARKATKTPFWDQTGFNAKFYEAAAIYARGDHTVLQGWDQAAHGSIQKAASAQRKVLDTMAKKLAEAGVQGAENLKANSAYVNRVWRHDKIRAAIATHGEAAVHDLLASSFYGMTAHGPLTGNVEKAASFLKVIRKLEFGTELTDVHLAARDMHTLRDELHQAGLSPTEIDTVVDVMFDARNADEASQGKPGNLKARMAIDETAKVRTPAGELFIHDLLENDSRVLVDRYMSTMGGHYGLARQGITSAADFRGLLREAEAEALANNHGDRFKKELAWLKDSYAHTVGRPMSMADYSGTARLFAAGRAYTRAATLGQLGIPAAFEMSHAIGNMGVRAFLKQLPSFRGFITALRQGFIPDPGLARQILQISGHGAEMAMAYARSREISEDLPAHVLSGAEHWGNRLSHATDTISGNASLTAITRQLSAKMSIQFLHDLGESASRMTPKVRDRLAGHGLEGQWADDVVKDLRSYADTRNGAILKLRLDDWLRDAPDTYEAFQTFVGRQVRDVIQDHDLGETMPFMHNTLGKVFSELKTFFLVGHAKNLLKNLNYGDGTTMAVLMYGMVGEAMGYAMQQALNNPDKLEQRLDPAVMGPAVMFRMSALGFAPMLAETGYQMATGKSLMAAGSTASGTNNRNLFMTPSFATGQALWNLPGHALQKGLGTSPYTGAEFKSDMRAVPLANTYGARGLINWWANTMPTSNKP